MNKSGGKILVIRGGAIGDFILTLPVLTALRIQFPNAHLEVLGYPHIAQLALGDGLADAVQSIEAGALAGFFARQGRLEPRLQDYFSQFAIIISYLYDPDGIFQENVGRCSRAQFIAGPHRPNNSDQLHAGLVFLRPLERLAIFEADPVPRLRRSLHVPPSRPMLALHPGSGSEHKNWPETNWGELIQYLLEKTKTSLLLVGGEAEGNRLQRLAGTTPSRRISVAQSLPLKELAQRLTDCTGFVGHDSGISHLASALGLPTLVLWGDSVETVWRPQGEWVKVICSGSGLGNLSARLVAKELNHWIFQDRERL